MLPIYALWTAMALAAGPTLSVLPESEHQVLTALCDGRGEYEHRYSAAVGQGFALAAPGKPWDGMRIAPAVGTFHICVVLERASGEATVELVKWPTCMNCSVDSVDGVSLSDVNGDGRPDLLLAGSGSTGFDPQGETPMVYGGQMYGWLAASRKEGDGITWREIDQDTIDGLQAKDLVDLRTKLRAMSKIPSRALGASAVEVSAPIGNFERVRVVAAEAGLGKFSGGYRNYGAQLTLIPLDGRPPQQVQLGAMEADEYAANVSIKPLHGAELAVGEVIVTNALLGLRMATGASIPESAGPPSEAHHKLLWSVTLEGTPVAAEYAYYCKAPDAPIGDPMRLPAWIAEHGVFDDDYTCSGIWTRRDDKWVLIRTVQPA